MKFTLEIDCGGDAFMPEPWWEVSDLLREVAARVTDQGAEGHYADIPVKGHKGATVGRWTFTDADDPEA